MGLGNLISTGISKAVSFIGSAFSSITPSITNFATKLISPFNKILLAIEVVSVVINIVAGIAELLGLKPEKESAEELGAKAKEAPLKQDDFESTEAYIHYLRNEIELDKEKFEKMDEHEKLACSAVGASLYAKNIEERIGVKLSPEFLLIAGKLEMKALEVKAFIDSFKENGLKDMQLMGEYLSGKLDEKTDTKVESAIIKGFKSMNPEMSKNDIQNKIADMTKETLRPEEK